MPRRSNDTRAAGFTKMQKKLGKVFKTIREGKKMTKVDLAKQLKVSEVSVANWEKGESVTLYTVWLYAKMAKSSIGDFLIGYDKVIGG